MSDDNPNIHLAINVLNKIEEFSDFDSTTFKIYDLANICGAFEKDCSEYFNRNERDTTKILVMNQATYFKMIEKDLIEDVKIYQDEELEESDENISPSVINISTVSKKISDKDKQQIFYNLPIIHVYGPTKFGVIVKSGLENDDEVICYLIYILHFIKGLSRGKIHVYTDDNYQIPQHGKEESVASRTFIKFKEFFPVEIGDIDSIIISSIANFETGSLIGRVSRSKTAKKILSLSTPKISRFNKYYLKYLKYKQKYLLLKQSISV